MRGGLRTSGGLAAGWAVPAALLLALLLSGCLTSTTADPPAPSTTRVPIGPTASALAEMAGRWMLSSPAGGACGMRFTGPPGAVDGTIAPEGGCPGNFFTSRRWAFDQNALVIRNHNGDPLGRLALSSSSRFDGQATTGEAISLTR
jgi:hypothetical protein